MLRTELPLFPQPTLIFNNESQFHNLIFSQRKRSEFMGSNFFKKAIVLLVFSFYMMNVHRKFNFSIFVNLETVFRPFSWEMLLFLVG
jgi:hypothetical protein